MRRGPLIALLVAACLGLFLVLSQRHRRNAFGWASRLTSMVENRGLLMPIQPAGRVSLPVVGEDSPTTGNTSDSRPTTTSASSATTLPQAAPRMHVLTFADRPTVYLDALAASVWHFNSGQPLHVLGLSGRRTPAVPGPRWNITRQSISGADPGKLKKLWFVGSLLDQPEARLRRLGFAEDDLLLFVDAFDVIVSQTGPIEF